MTAVTCDSCGQGALARGKGDEFRTVEDDYFLGFVSGEGRGWRRTFACFAFVVFFAEGSLSLPSVSVTWCRVFGGGEGWGLPL